MNVKFWNKWKGFNYEDCKMTEEEVKVLLMLADMCTRDEISVQTYESFLLAMARKGINNERKM